MKLFTVAFVAALLCAAAVTAAPSSSHTELVSFDGEVYDIVDTITKAFEKLKVTVKCSVDAIGKIVGEGALKADYEKFKKAVKTVYERDMPKCTKTEGFLEKLKCVGNVSGEISKIFGEFMKKVYKTNKVLATRIYKAVKTCANHKQIDEFAFEDDEIVESFDENDFTFGISDIITKKFKQLVEKMKCSVKATGEAIQDSELKAVFVKFQKDFKNLLKNDVKKCLVVKGLKEKMECTYNTIMRGKKMMEDFYKQVLEANKELAAFIVMEVQKKCFSHDTPKPEEPEKPEF